MSVRLGTVVEGNPYSVQFDSDAVNPGYSYVFVGWEPAPGNPPQSFPMRIQAGQTGRHQKTAPAASKYFLIEIRVDVPEPGGGTLTVKGLVDGDEVVSVSKDEIYWVEIVSS